MMAPMSKATATEPQGRSSLRLPPELLAAIDAARAKRPGKISRNTWITEAVQEKLRREAGANDQGKPPHG